MNEGLGLFLKWKRKVKSPGGVAKYVHDQIIFCWREGVRAFIHECVDTYRVHVDTGMSMASLYPLATNVKLGSFVRSQIQAYARGPRKPAYDLQGKPTSGFKSQAAGERAGSIKGPGRSYDIEFGTPAHPILRFEFHILVYQYILHEAGLITPPQHGDPWDSLIAGRSAFLGAFNLAFSQRVNSKKILENILE